MAVPSGFRFTRRWWVPLAVLFAGLFVHFIVAGWLLSGMAGAIGLLWVFAAKLGHVPFDD
ncbi:MAG: hypothetical protein AAF676_11685 [Pseudomonadota bacterium]